LHTKLLVGFVHHRAFVVGQFARIGLRRPQERQAVPREKRTRTMTSDARREAEDALRELGGLARRLPRLLTNTNASFR
jgi:hypothetical protein